MRASEAFKAGEWNYCVQEVDVRTGIRTVTILKHKWRRPHSFKVRRLYQPDEEIVEDEEFEESREGEGR